MEVEPNDGFGTATFTGVGLGFVQGFPEPGFDFYASYGNYIGSGDNDYHYLYAQRGNTISINTSGRGSYADDVDTTITLFNQYYTQVGFDNNSGSGLNSSLTYKAPLSGYYYFNVAGYLGDTGNYDITVNLTPNLTT
ncbi:hypothetical protein [Nostoc sphaeroides]|uniref:Peptidase C-terminal archaeal/bacterial domain-containing protein n=1 Tax=Nostoc sphaeroides CCNUC1 TaxID=2653204 RepID=A0A5P8W2Z9_9NOSO|nr:hypothetical protein [Nostoc sphaeroides]MCC5630476.1 hypothetical protein [Nostoc sphaeroides CHAB 2801]QFS46399.1 hypothetical protein GXM_03880 [Nostoc sphaeroides CCNUC1]